ncbi:hypothetical protein [Methanothrix sp.]
MALGLQNKYSRFSGGSTPIHNVLFPGARTTRVAGLTSPKIST